MPTIAHTERHSISVASVRDIVIGMADGLTVPFALAAGITGAIASTRIVVTAGLAEIAAGSIAMGLGGYLAAKTDAEHYDSEMRREIAETVEIPDQEEEEVAKVFRGYGLAEEHLRPVVTAIVSNQKRWVDFMMRFELGLEEPEKTRAARSAVTIFAAYIVGGLIPLAPYMLMPRIFAALEVSVGVTLLALLAFGYFKARFTGVSPIRGALQTAFVGGLAAAAAFFLARVVNLR